MPLHVTLEAHTANPGIVCDYCGEAITTAADGNYQWQTFAHGTTDGTIYFTHKRCCYPFEHQHGGNWGVLDLSWLLVFLKNTLRVDMRKTEAIIRATNV